MMSLSLLLSTLVVLQDPAPHIILSDDPEPPVVAPIELPKPDLPAHALSDPYGWERSQCSPYIRKEESLEACQLRVRTDLQRVMGDRLPAGLTPKASLENCTPGTAANGYQVQCDRRGLNVPASPNLNEQVCQNVPKRQPNGTVLVENHCRPAHGTAPATPDQPRLSLFSRSNK